MILFVTESKKVKRSFTEYAGDGGHAPKGDVTTQPEVTCKTIINHLQGR